MRDRLRNLLASSLKVRSRSRSRSRSPTQSGGSRSSLGVCNHGQFKILVIGSDGVGKTELCQKYVGHTLDNLEQEELVFDTGIFINVEDEPRQYDLELFLVNADSVHGKDCSEYKKEILSADGYMLVYAKNKKQTFMKLIEIISDIRHFSHGSAPIVVVGSLQDTQQSCHEVTADDIVSLTYKHFDVSPKRNDGIQTAFNALVQSCIKAREAKQQMNE